MFLKSVRIVNFRRFGSENNVVFFASDCQVNNNVKCLNSTLIVGQNNAGKTSVVKALEKACKGDFKYTDFNYYHLRDLLENATVNKKMIKQYIEEPGNIGDDEVKAIWVMVPLIEIQFNFYVDVSENSKDLLTNIGSIITNDIPGDGLVSCIVRYETKNLLSFMKSFYEIVNKSLSLDEKFGEYLKFLDSFSNEYKTNCYVGMNESDPVDFKIGDLVKVNSVSFKELHSPSRLTDAFNKIYKYKVDGDDGTKETFNKQIEEINQNINSKIDVGRDISEDFNGVLLKTTDISKVSMELKANLSIDSLLSNIIRYVYKDGKFEIPEDQFGMGYTNLMVIISELVKYVDNSPEDDFYNKINLLIVEEPESYMHPQMQKVLIENINLAFYAIIGSKPCANDNINCQLAITTHSPYVLNGKLGVENSFNNVNYIRFIPEKCSLITPLRDSDISTSDNGFEFLKRYIKFKCCELFFADAAIFVEGQAEETLIPFFISEDPKLTRKYISVFAINGAHFKTYEKLIEVLGIPIVIITDLDIEGSKKDDAQITSLEGRATTNAAIMGFGMNIGTGSNKVKGNVFVSTQSVCFGVYPTSFEEAIILANKDNELVKETLSELHPIVYKNENWESSLATKSHVIQNYLRGDKGLFASTLLYKMIENKDKNKGIVLPQYIVDGFDFIKENLSLGDGDDDGQPA